MKITYVSTYLPKRCGIATYTDYLIRGIRKVEPTSELRIIAEQGAAPIKQDKFEVIPCWDRNEDYVKPIISHAKGADVIHIQHEYSIYKRDNRLPSVLFQTLSDLNENFFVTIFDRSHFLRNICIYFSSVHNLSHFLSNNCSCFSFFEDSLFLSG